MSDTRPMDTPLATTNAGTTYSLDQARVDAKARAAAHERDVEIFEHVGGRAGAKVIPANGSYLWRDAVDDEGRPLNPPKFYRRLEVIGWR